MAAMRKPNRSLKEITMAKGNTSQKIRYLASIGKSVGEIEDLLAEFHVTTKDGGHIRYQHVRNVLMTRLSSDNDA